MDISKGRHKRETRGEKWTHKQKKGRSGWVSLCQRGPGVLLMYICPGPVNIS